MSESVRYAPSLSAALYILTEATQNLSAEQSKTRGPYRKTEASAFMAEIDTVNLAITRSLAESGFESGARGEILARARDLIARLKAAEWV